MLTPGKTFHQPGLFSSIPAHSNEVQNWIMKGMEPNSITIIGAYHKRPESIQFFQSIISKYFQQNKCLVVALEIASNQQVIIDEIVEGKSTISDIEIPPMSDHPPFRALINDLIGIRKHNDCLKLIAIDAELELKTNRDEWMAIKLSEQASQVPVLALLGSLHTLKKVDWNPAIIEKEPYVAEILVARGFNVKSYPQVWRDRACNSKAQLISADKPDASKLLNTDLFALLNASKPETVTDIIDGIVLWECS